MKDFIIRLEKKEDYRATENLIREAFWNVYKPGADEHYFVHQMRNHPDFIPELEVNGPENGNLLVVGWGGTDGHLLSAVQEVRESGVEVSFAHFDYIMPLPRNTEEVFSKFDKILVCELNSGHFVNYLRGVMPEFTYSQFNKVQGQPFLVQEIVSAIKNNL